MTIYTPPIQVDRSHSIDRLKTPFWDAIGAAADDAFVHNPVSAIGRIAGLEAERMGAVGERVSPEELNERYGDLGLNFDRAERMGAVSVIVRRKQEELTRRDALSRASKDLGTQGALLLTGLAVSVADPINVGSAFIPVVGQARYASWLARMGATRARVARGAIEGAAGAAIVEPLILAAAAHDQSDYGALDSLLNVAFGTALGGGLHAGFGKVSDMLHNTDPAVREGALRASVAQMAEGRPVDINHVLRTDPAFFDPESPNYRTLAPLVDRVNRERAALDEANTRLDAQRTEAARLKAERISEALPEIIARHLDETTGLLLRDIQDQLDAPGLSAARRAELERQRGQIIESVQDDIGLAIGRAEAEARGIRIAEERARARLDEEMDRLGFRRDETARLTPEQRAERQARTQIEAGKRRLTEAQERLQRAVNEALERGEPMPRVSPHGRDRVDSEGPKAIEHHIQRQLDDLEGGPPLDADEAAAVGAADEAVAKTSKEPESLNPELEALDEDVAYLTGEIEALHKQGALDDADVAALDRGLEAEDVKAHQDAAMAAARCLVIHP